MQLRPKGKVLFLALAICIVFSVVFTGTLAAAILDHECTGEADGCPFCLQIDMAKIFLKTLTLALLTLFIAGRFSFPAQTAQKFTGFFSSPNSPVKLKVRFNT